MEKWKTKWITYAQNNLKEKMSELVLNYPKNVSRFIQGGLNDFSIVSKEVNYLQTQININNYGHHKDGESHLIKLINGWLSEDIIRILLQDLNAKINGADFERKVDTRPTNDPDLNITIDGWKYFIEITNINRVKVDGNYLNLELDINEKKSKFNHLKSWQARQNKYSNLYKKHKDKVFLLNITDNLDSVMIKYVKKINKIIIPDEKNKWASYIGKGLTLDEEYFVFLTKGMSLKMISEAIVLFIKKLIRGENE